jgi:double-strand break repair protein MRE11
VGTFRITQPGSSVATALTGGEAVRKQVGLLEIKYNQFRLKSIPLTQVRSFVMGEVSLQDRRSTFDPEDPKIDKKITAFLEEEVNVLKHEAIDKYQNLLRDAAVAGNAADTDKLKYKLQKPEEVLVRLKVEHSGYSTLNNQRFGAKFVGALANPVRIFILRISSKTYHAYTELTYSLSLSFYFFSLFRSSFTVRCALVSQAQDNGRVEEEKEES